jgi:hypothetical protein
MAGRFRRSAGHQHPPRDLVAVGDAHESVRAVGVDHVLDGIGDQLVQGQAVQHALVPHGDAVVHGDGVEPLGHCPCPMDLSRHQFAQRLEVATEGSQHYPPLAAVAPLVIPTSTIRPLLTRVYSIGKRAILSARSRITCYACAGTSGLEVVG